MNEKPLERLNYYNGMPLNAADFKTEQEYHMRTRRWLNKSLYSAGIARGLEVREVPKSPSVVVSPGLAIDSEGREIILLEEATVEVCSYAGTDESTVVGNYLVIEYAEETIAYEQSGCAVRTAGTCASKSTTNWGGPSRIQAQVKFSWVPFVPHPGSNQIVLAQVELTSPNCDSVHQIDPGERHYIGATSAAKVRQYALEGERHIDSNNPGRIYFYIRGQEPNSVSLCLRSERFSTLYYTELGQHSHSLTVAGTLGGPVKTDGAPSINTDTEIGSTGTEPTPHEHNNFEATYYGDNGTEKNHAIGLIDLTPAFGTAAQGNLLKKVSTDGTIRLNSSVAIPSPPPDLRTLDAKITGATPHIHQHDHTHAFTQGSSSGVDPAGISDLTARDDAPTNPEKALTYVDDLQVWIGPDIDSLVNRTEDIRRQLQSIRPSQEDWSKLGEGPTKPDHALIKKGTGLIRLDFLPTVSFSEGEYVIDLRVASGGGRIHYNLYIE